MTGSRTAIRTHTRFPPPGRRRSWRRLTRIFAVTVVLAAAGGAGWLVGWSDLTALDSVRVHGARDELADRVVETVDAPLGVPLIWVDTGRLEQRASALPELAAVSVHRAWPRAIVVDVTPRVPRAALNAGGSWWSVDAAGVLFARSADRPAGLPVLEAPSAADDAAARAAGVAVLTSLPADLANRVEQVSAHGAADVQLTLDSGAAVEWGAPAQSDQKAAALRALLAEDAQRYDVSAPDRPAITP